MSADLPPSVYNGAPWRSRFLRGPKIGLELAARDDFVSLGTPEVSTVRLGLKTGNDAFFFLDRAGKSTASRVTLEGLGGFVGDFPLADVRPGIRTPKELDTASGRLAAVPVRRGRYAGDTYYLFPRTNRLDRHVKTYVEYGEARGVNSGRLVRANAESASQWYCQTRAQVTSRWVLPYNSGYDYGAIDNSIGAVLNGRLIGVEPSDGIDPDVLGGILNSTFVTLMRLLEGVSTGNEGAFDVGPPSARVMRVPDPRKMTSTGADSLAGVMREIVAAEVLPHAPLANGTVPPLRQKLDLAVLAALGLSKGEAAVLLDRMYQSYARWRAAVEAVEDQMQEHRRALSRRGGSRSVSPEDRAARTVWDEMSPACPPLLNDLLGSDHDLLDARLRSDDNAAQDALFDSAMALDATGNGLDLGDTARLDLVRYLRGLGVNGVLPVPRQADVCRVSVTSMQEADASFVEEAARRSKAHVSDDLVDQVVTMTRRAWIAKSITSLRQAMAADDDEAAADPSLFETEGLVPPLS